MRVITKHRLRCFWEGHADAEQWLRVWHATVKAGKWQSLLDVRRIYPHADPVKVASGKTSTVFNVCGNKYRMATAIHYDSQRVFVLWLGTHAEYDKGSWKGRL